MARIIDLPDAPKWLLDAKIKVRAGFTHRVGKNPWESEADGDV